MRVDIKINLSLRVGGRRPDGYHELATIFIALPLGDDLALSSAPVTSVAAPGLPGGDGLVSRALTLLAARAGHGGGWRVRLDKRAPVGAGLGGGSADAGLALRLANATLPDPLPDADLIALAGEVGSDVPFFASGLPAALARGRGELLEPCAVGAAVWAVVAWPGAELSTAQVYAAYRPAPDAAERVAALSAAAFATADAAQLSALVENDLGAPAEALCPAAAALRARLLAGGALTACVSGSGSAVFGLYASGEAAREAAGDIAASVPWAAFARLPQGGAAATITV